MAYELAGFDAAQSGIEVVSAVDGKIVRVLHMVVTSWAAASICLLSDPGGPEETYLTRMLHFAGGQPLVVHLGRALAVCGARGKSVGIALAYQAAAQPLSLALWYERVT